MKIQLFALTIAVVVWHGYASCRAEAPLEYQKHYMTITDSAGRVILQTGLTVMAGDQFIAEDNKLYDITQVNGQSGTAVLRQQLSSEFLNLPAGATWAQQAGNLVDIYHTHSDESYPSSDGKSTIPGAGGIIKVGDTFAARLQELGFAVNHDKTAHDPHDANAYDRSRQTVFRLLAQQPVAIFDIHRDSAPVSAYKAMINNQPVSKLMLVVGQANPSQPTTLDYAKKLKAASDQLYPKLIRGIFIGHGSYNQDLSPRAILVEAGTEGSSRDEAARGLALFADTLPLVIGRPNDNPQSPEPGPLTQSDNQTATKRNILGILLYSGLGILLFLFLSTGSFNEAKAKLRRLKNVEFTHWLGKFGRKK